MAFRNQREKEKEKKITKRNSEVKLNQNRIVYDKEQIDGCDLMVGYESRLLFSEDDEGWVHYFGHSHLV